MLGKGSQSLARHCFLVLPVRRDRFVDLRLLLARASLFRRLLQRRLQRCLQQLGRCRRLPEMLIGHLQVMLSGNLGRVA